MPSGSDSMKVSTESWTAAFQLTLKGFVCSGGGRAGNGGATATEHTLSAQAGASHQPARELRSSDWDLCDANAPASSIAGTLSGVPLELQLSLLLSVCFLRVAFRQCRTSVTCSAGWGPPGVRDHLCDVPFSWRRTTTAVRWLAA